jgi:hypothetical protein
MARIKAKATKQQKTLKETLTELILLGLRKSEKTGDKIPNLPQFHLGSEKIDIADRAKLYDIWDAKE